MITETCYLDRPGTRPSWRASQRKSHHGFTLSAARIDLQGARLIALAPGLATSLAGAIVAMPPWSAMHYPADAMARFLAASGDGVSRWDYWA